MTEAGPTGRVASADRVRRGGVAGFFAREHFEVIIEFDDVGSQTGAATSAAAGTPVDDTAAASWAAGGAAPRSWSDLADGTEDVLEIGSATEKEAAGEDLPLDPPRPALAVTPVPAPLGSEARQPSTQKASFAAMLSAIARDTLAEPAAPETAATSGAPDVDEADPAPAVAPVTGRTLSALVSGQSQRAWLAAAGDQGAEQPLTASDLLARAEVVRPDDADEAEPVGEVSDGLAALGLPGHLLPEASVLRCLEGLRTTEDAHTYVQIALTSALQALPPAPTAPERPGSVMVVVGELDRALECAAQIADRVGVDLEAVVVASQARHRRGIASRHLVATPDEAVELVARSRRGTGPTIIAMHAPVSADPDRWATRMLVALAPTAVWGVAPATVKAQDLGAWADGLGGLDALAMDDMAATSSPAQALAAGVPVACLDGQRATPALWAALIAARLLPRLLLDGARERAAEA
jgi:hypothetical protein